MTTQASEIKQYPWTRYWAPAGTKPQPDAFGFVSRRVSGYQSQTSIGQTLSELESVPCLVLLGEPASGKSTEFASYQYANPDAIVAKYALNRTSSYEAVIHAIENLPEFKEWLTGSRSLHLYLDSLDEASLHIRTIHRALVDWINENKRAFKITLDPVNPVAQTVPEAQAVVQNNSPHIPSFFIRFFCRSADWKMETTASLRSIFGDDQVKLLELVPLTQEDARILAHSEGIDDDKFVTAISDSDASFFAGEPEMLKFLHKNYQDGLLTGARTDRVRLFYEGCLRYCNEFNPGYQHAKKLSSLQRLNIASRLATYSIFTNRSGIWKQDTLTSSSDDLQLDDIAGDVFMHEGREQQLFIPDVIEALNTGLFNMLDEERMKFKQQTFVEFLAARHLNDIATPAKILRQLVTSPHDPLRTIPQLNEVVGWLFRLNPEAIDLLIDTEPMLLTRSRRTFNHTQAARIVNALLNNANQFQLMDDHGYTSYANLNYPGLTKVIRPFINSKKYNVVARRIAVNIAGDCNLTTLVPDLLNLLNTETEEGHLRKYAITSLEQMLTPKVVGTLKVFATTARTDDVDDELKGSALKVLYPQELSTQEMLQALTRPKRNNLWAAYKAFMYGLGSRIPKEDFEIALATIAADDKFFSGSHDRFERLLEEVITRAWLTSLTALGVQNFATILYKVIEHFIDIQVPVEAQQRLEVAKALISKVEEPTRIYSIVGIHTNRMLTVEDWQWAVDEFNRAEDYERVKLGKVLWLLLNFSNEQHVVQFMETIFPFPDVVNSFGYHINAIKLDSEDAIKAKEHHSWQRKTKEKPKNPVKLRVLQQNKDVVRQAHTLISEYAATNTEAWSKVIDLMRIDIFKGQYDRNHVMEFDITRLPLWNNLTDEHDAIVRIASRYLSDYKPNTGWINSREFDLRDVAGYKAMLLLYTWNKGFFVNLSATFWETWQETVLYCSFRTINELPESRKFLLSEAWKNTSSQQDFLKLIQAHLVSNLQRGDDLYDLYKLKPVASEALAKVLLTLFHHDQCKPRSRDYILDFVFSNSLTQALSFARKMFTQLSAKEKSDEQRAAAIQASSRLLVHPDDQWDSFFKAFQKSKHAKEIFLAAAPTFSFNDTRQLRTMSAGQKADVLFYLMETFPPEQDPQHEMVYSPSDHDAVVQYRSQIIRALIEDGTPEGIEVFKSVIRKLPNSENLKWWLVSARETMRANSWRPFTTTQLRTLLRNAARRFVRSESELTDVIVESLDRLQKKLLGNNPTALFLWDKKQSKSKNKTDKPLPRKPKPKSVIHRDENYLSDFIKMHLEYDLIGQRIIMNREVEINRGARRGDGSRTDLFIQTINPEDATDMISVVIEVKGCWHDELEDAMETQLRDKYLSQYKSKAGIYLIGWFYGPHMVTPRRYKNLRMVKRKFEQQAVQVSRPFQVIRSYVLDCRI